MVMTMSVRNEVGRTLLSLAAARCTESWQKSMSVGKSKLKQVAAPGAKESKYTVPWILRTNGWQNIYS